MISVELDVKNQHLSQIHVEPAFFPSTEMKVALATEILTRAGEGNVDYVIGYGSQVTGDASPTSMIDVMVVVRNLKKYHQANLITHKRDYGTPRVAAWHAFLNTFGFSFYHSSFQGDDGRIRPLKLAIISTRNFIKGCNGTFKHGVGEREGAFGLFVAGRIQKVALSPLYKTEEETASTIESAMNMARIDGVWFAMGLLQQQFSYEELVHMYVSLSYKADIRIEKKGKIETLIESNKADYVSMLEPILNAFIASGLLKKNGDLFVKIISLPEKELLQRMRELKRMAFLMVYVKGIFTAGLSHGVIYALAKFKRVAQSYRTDKRIVE